jgi:hypothetical protein
MRFDNPATGMRMYALQVLSQATSRTWLLQASRSNSPVKMWCKTGRTYASVTSLRQQDKRPAYMAIGGRLVVD